MARLHCSAIGRTSPRAAASERRRTVGAAAAGGARCFNHALPYRGWSGGESDRGTSCTLQGARQRACATPLAGSRCRTCTGPADADVIVGVPVRRARRGLRRAVRGVARIAGTPHVSLRCAYSAARPCSSARLLTCALDKVDAVLVVDANVDDGDAAVDALRVQGALAGRGSGSASARRSGLRRS